jgi:phosphate transport system substrate-binding protein
MLLMLVGLLSFTAVSCSEAKRPAVVLEGAGATFPAPLYRKWLEHFRTSHPEVAIHYDAVGSGAGIQLFTGSLVDFGASDAAMTDAQIRQVAGGVQMLPMTAGMVVLAYNLTDVKEPIKLSREAYADIFLGKITHWNDPKITITNPGMSSISSTPITVVHRLGASGTTYVFTQHLSAISEEWNKEHSFGLTVDWPNAKGAKGNDGVVAMIQKTPGAIGYLDFGTAQRNHLSVASLQNKAGNFVEPSQASCQASFADVTLPSDLRAWVTDPEAKNGYPVVTFTWILARPKYDSPKTAEAVKQLLTYGLTEGQKDCAPLGYAPLPDRVRQTVLEAVNKISS